MIRHISKMEIIELPRIEDAYIAGYKSFFAKNNLYIFEDKKVLCLSLFPHSLRIVRTQKQRFVHHSVWSNARNAVSAIFLFGNMQSSCHKSLAHFSMPIMTPFLASNRTELPQCQPYSAI